jgi:hypothetical protein
MKRTQINRKPSTLTRKPLKKKAGSALKRQKTPLEGAKKKKTRKGSDKTVSALMKELDAVFSRWVRISNSDAEGYASCYTCGFRAHYKKLQNGHYISRFYKKYRFDERNCRVQCAMCNMWKSGDIPTYRMKLIEEIGSAEVESMERDYKELYRLDKDFLIAKIAYYKAILESVENQENLHTPVQE